MQCRSAGSRTARNPKGDAMNERLESVASEIAASMLANELERCAKTRPERLAEATDEMKAEYVERMRWTILGFMESLSDKEYAYSRLRNGTFHPSNRNYRKAFHGLTGIKLPAGANATRDAVREWIGEEFVAAKEAEAASSRAAAEYENERKRAEAHATAMDRLKAKFSEGLTGEELLELARHVGIDVHPRTAGMLKRRIAWIGDGTARVRGKGGAGDAFVVRDAVADALAPVADPA